MATKEDTPIGSLDGYPIFSEDEKHWLLNSLDLKRASLRRALNSATDGSSVSRAINEDMAFVDKLMTKVFSL